MFYVLFENKYFGSNDSCSFSPFETSSLAIRWKVSRCDLFVRRTNDFGSVLKACQNNNNNKVFKDVYVLYVLEATMQYTCKSMYIVQRVMKLQLHNMCDVHQNLMIKCIHWLRMEGKRATIS